jgi:hypothetical protein
VKFFIGIDQTGAVTPKEIQAGGRFFSDGARQITE